MNVFDGYKDTYWLLISASEIMGFVESSLPSAATPNTVIMGFPTEEEMVATLQNLSRPILPSCFAGGAGSFHRP